LPCTVTGGRGPGASEEQSAFSTARGRDPPPELIAQTHLALVHSFFTPARGDREEKEKEEEEEEEEDSN
jgi:hypothetical protein